MVEFIKPRMGIVLAAISFAFVVGLCVVSADAETPIVTFRDCQNVCPEMVVIPAGKFQMGAPEHESRQERARHADPIILARESPQHTVLIRHAFALGKYDVTREEFSDFIRETGYQTAKTCISANQTASEESPGFSWRKPGFVQTNRDPVVCVSWNDAQAYVNWLSRKTSHTYRLPTEAEWEYAARAGTTTNQYWGNDQAAACRYANIFDLEAARDMKFYFGVFHCRDGYIHTSPVGSLLPNRFGLYDMLGNVQQWTEDCFNDSYNGAPTDGSPWISGDCSKHIVRGLSFGQGDSDDGAFAREQGYSAHQVYVGFRVARTY